MLENFEHALISVSPLDTVLFKLAIHYNAYVSKSFVVYINPLDVISRDAPLTKCSLPLPLAPLFFFPTRHFAFFTLSIRVLCKQFVFGNIICSTVNSFAASYDSIIRVIDQPHPPTYT